MTLFADHEIRYIQNKESSVVATKRPGQPYFFTQREDKTVLESETRQNFGKITNRAMNFAIIKPTVEKRVLELPNGMAEELGYAIEWELP